MSIVEIDTFGRVFPSPRGGFLAIFFIAPTSCGFDWQKTLFCFHNLVNKNYFLFTEN
jgi:hypothetical protein